MMASSAPTQSMLESTVRSKARTEKREAYRARTLSSGRAMITPRAAPAVQRTRPSASRVRRKALVPAPRAARVVHSPSLGTVRAGIRLGALDQALLHQRAD